VCEEMRWEKEWKSVGTCSDQKYHVSKAS
jgi:hypothetical protein